MQLSWRLLENTESVGMKSRRTFRVGQMTSAPNGTRMPWIPPFVRMRYTSRIYPGVDQESLLGRDPWTKEEDELLWEAFQRLGNKWHAISSNLSGRPGL